MEVIGHVDDVVDHLADLGDWEPLQVPIRRRRGNRDGLAGQQILQDDQESKVIISVLRVIRGNVGDIRSL